MTKEEIAVSIRRAKDEELFIRYIREYFGKVGDGLYDRYDKKTGQFVNEKTDKIKKQDK